MVTKSIFDLESIERELVTSQVKKRVHSSILRNLFQLETPKQPLAQEVDHWISNIRASHQDHFLTLVQRDDSKIDGSSKLLFKTLNDQKIEAVILRSKKDYKNTVCISTQVGCTEKCQFCATAKLPFERNLTKDEILTQVLLMRQILKSEGRPLTHVVFMGMGEPLRNYRAVSQSLTALTSPRHFKLSPRAITVSTLGIPRSMLALAKDHPQVHLALSLHAPNDRIRRSIMPINDRYPIGDLMETLVEIEQIHHYTVMISYLILKGRNDQVEHAQELVRLMAGRRIIFNLIPYNSIDNDLGLEISNNDDFQGFKNTLIKAGFPVTVRHSFGPDIDAACGQLARKENHSTPKNAFS
jgi:23S rRNA (adenine2503-C2)-methyltransferase